MSTVSSPVNFNDLKAASVYYEILDCDPTNLQAICPEEQFEKRPDGTLSYYSATANGSYVHASGNRGEFVKMTRLDGREVFLHYSQVFGPTLAARRRMGILAQALGAAYQSTNRQMAMLNDLITEAAALNESMRKFNDIYYSFAARAVNYNSGLTNQMLMIEPALLKLYLDNGLRLPLNRICNGVIPQLYAKITNYSGDWQPFYQMNWNIFYVDNTGSSPDTKSVKSEWVTYRDGITDSLKPISPPSLAVVDCANHGEISRVMNSPENMKKQFSSTAKYKLSSSDGGFSPIKHDGTFYAKCGFDPSGNITYKYLFGVSYPEDVTQIDLNKPYELYPFTSESEVDVSESCYSYTVTLEEVLNGKKTGYFSQKEANALLDQIRVAIDQLNNKLSGLSTVIGVYNQDLQQNYTVATSALEATEEAQQKTTRNIR